MSGRLIDAAQVVGQLVTFGASGAALGAKVAGRPGALVGGGVGAMVGAGALVATSAAALGNTERGPVLRLLLLPSTLVGHAAAAVLGRR